MLDSLASISGGCANLAGTGSQPNVTCSGTGLESILGGRLGEASGQYSAIGGGFENTASARYGSVSGGESNTASDGSGTGADIFPWVGGGEGNTASGLAAAVLGGKGNTAASSCLTVPAAPNDSC